MASWGNSTKHTKKNNTYNSQTVQKIVQVWTLPNSFYKAIVILLPKPEKKKIPKRRNYQTITLINIAANILIVVHCSVMKSCPTLCNCLGCSMRDFLVIHYLYEFAQTHVHWVSDAIQPSHPLSTPSPPALNLSHQDLFQWVGCSHQVAKKLKHHHQCLQWIFSIDFLWNWLVWPPFSLRTLKSLLQHDNPKASVLWHSALFMVQN